MGSRSNQAMPNHLVIRRDPVPGETMIGYLQRLCIANGYDSLQWIFDKHISSPDKIFLDKNIMKIADVTKSDYELIKHHSYGIVGNSGREINFHGFHINRAWINIKSLNICPHCLLERPVFQSVWDLVDFTACPIHGIKIVNRCPACRRNLSVMRVSNTCEYGMLEYDDYFTGKTYKSEISCASHISFLLGDKNNTGPSTDIHEKVRMLSFSYFLCLVHRLYSFPKFSEKSSGYVVNVARLSSDYNDCVRYSMSVLRNWPDGFYTHIEDFSVDIFPYIKRWKENQKVIKKAIFSSYIREMRALAIKVDGTDEIWEKRWRDINDRNKLI